jgi:hypothetical protein
VGATTGTHRLAVLGTLVALATSACETEPPTVRLVLRVERDVAAQLKWVEVSVTTSVTTTAGDWMFCHPCTRVFSSPDFDFTSPIIIDYIRGADGAGVGYDRAWYIIRYALGSSWEGHRYHWIDFPESGLASTEVVLTTSCLLVDCLPEEDCIGGRPCRDPGLPIQVVAGDWMDQPCARDCGLPEVDADADADADAGADADADAHSDVDTFADSDTMVDGDVGTSDADSARLDDGGP